MPESYINLLCSKAAKYLGVDWNSFEIEAYGKDSIVIRLDSDKSLYLISRYSVTPL